jgi:hypothetical protein
MHGADIPGSVEFQMSLLLFVALADYVLTSFQTHKPINI